MFLLTYPNSHTTSTTLAFWHNSFEQMRFPQPVDPEHERNLCEAPCRCELQKILVSCIKKNKLKTTYIYRIKLLLIAQCFA